MRKTCFIAIVGILLLSKSALASPVINSIEFVPSQELWLGEALTIKVNCTDVYAIENVTAEIVGEDGYTIPPKILELQAGLYTAVIDPLYLNKPNNFSVNVFCINNFSQSSSKTARFTVSRFNTAISRVYPAEIYLDSQIEVDLSVNRNNIPITRGVEFRVFLNSQRVYPKVHPPYDPARGWIVYLASPTASGTYKLDIDIIYGRVSRTEQATIIVKDPVQFSISSDRTWIKPNETVNIKVHAFDRGNTIPINKDNLSVRVGTARPEITAITPISNYFNLAVQMPNLPPDKYELVVMLFYKNYTYSNSTPIYYVVPITGRITDENGKGVSAQLRFLTGIEVLRLYTDSSGSYSGILPPGTYDIEITFPQSILRLYGVAISSFEDPIRYYSLSSAEVPGLNLAGLYVYEVALRYSRASIEMKYDESKVLNEGQLKVYRCSEWNTGRRTCYVNWEEVRPTVDTIKNTVSIDTTQLSAYAIGTLKRLSVEFNLNKEKFYLRDLIRIRGMVVDDFKSTVNNASVKVYIKGTNISANALSDNNGLFSIEFLSPEKEGKYSLILSAEKWPYIPFESGVEIEIVKSKEFSIVFPDTVRVKRGASTAQEFTLVNTGQADLYDLTISLTGMPEGYYSLIDSIDKLAVGEEKRLTAYFYAPANATLGTSSATLKVFNQEVSKEKRFGFTIEAEQNVTVQPPVTGFTPFALPEISIVYLVLFAVSSFTLAFVLKKRKLENQRRDEIKNFLLNVKNLIKERRSFQESQHVIARENTQENTEQNLDDKNG